MKQSYSKVTKDASYVISEYNRRRGERTMIERTWLMNRDFVENVHYSNKLNDNLTNEGLNPSQQPVEFNKIAPIMERRYARISARKPIARCTPISESEEDEKRAFVSNKLLEHFEVVNSFDKVKDKSIHYLDTYGTVFYKTVWDASMGELLSIITEEYDEDEHRIPSKREVTGKNVVKVQKKIMTGDPIIDCVSPFEIYPDDLFSNGIEENKSIIHAKAYPISTIYEVYGIVVSPEPINSITMQNGTFSETSRNPNYTSGNTTLKDYAMVYEYYEKPSDDNPDGLLIIVVGNQLYYNSAMDKESKIKVYEYPFSMAKAITTVDRFFGQSVIERLIKLQRRYNSIRNKMGRHLERLAVGSFAVEEGSLVDGSELNNEDGNIINIKRGRRYPEAMRISALGQDAYNEIAQLEKEFSLLSGVYTSDILNLGSNVRSSGMMNQINEFDDEALTGTIKEFKNAIEDVAKKVLRLYRNKSTGNEFRKMSKDSDEYLYFTKNDINVDGVKIKNESEIMTSIEKQRQMVQNLLGQGFYDSQRLDEETKQDVLEQLFLGHMKKDVDNLENKQRKLQQREIKKIIQGQEIQVNDFDNHLLHKEELEMFLCSKDFEKIKKSSGGEVVAQKLLEHYKTHDMQVMLQLASMQQAENNK